MRGTRQPRFCPPFFSLGISGLPLALALLLSFACEADAAFDVVKCGQMHTCVLDTKYGSVKCWGYGYHRALGYSDNGDRYPPDGDNLPFVSLNDKYCGSEYMEVCPEGSKPIDIYTGNYNTCVIFEGGEGTCWGAYGGGVPQITEGQTIQSFGMGYMHTCVLLSDSTVSCAGQIMNTGGNGVLNFDGGRTVKELAIFDQSHNCAIFDDDLVRCWGSSNIYGQLGTGEDLGWSRKGISNMIAVDLGPGRTAKNITVGYGFSCAILDDNSVKCWGRNYDGQCGYGDGPGWSPSLGWLPAESPVENAPLPPTSPLPPPPPPSHQPGYEGPWAQNRGDEADASDMGANLPTVNLGTGRYAKYIKAGHDYVCALLDDATVKCWGKNQLGQLGYGDTKHRGHNPADMGDALPTVNFGTGRTVTYLDVGWHHACVVLDNGDIKCWGSNYNLGNQYGGGSGIGDIPSEMGDNLQAVSLGTFCEEDHYVQNNECKACLGGAKNARGDDPTREDTLCYCGKNQYVAMLGTHYCLYCPTGTMRKGGDPIPGGTTTSCYPIVLCSENQRVKDSECVPCPDGIGNAAGDDPSGVDTVCQSPAGPSPAAGAPSSDAASSPSSPSSPTQGKEDKKKQAEKTRDAILGDITNTRLKAKAKLLADAAIAGVKVKRLKAKLTADNEDTACSDAFTKAGMSASDGACVATAASSRKRRRLSSTTYDVELMFSSSTVSDDALAAAELEMKNNGVEGVSSDTAVDPIAELKTVPGVDTSKLQTFETEASDAADAAAESAAPPPAPPPPKPNLVLDDDDGAIHVRALTSALLATTLALVALT